MFQTINSIRKNRHENRCSRIRNHRLIYNACREDSAINRKLLKLDSNSRLVMITSGGCNVLHNLLDSPREIHAVDVNFRQNALLHLKMAAIKNLDFEDFFQLFGKGYHDHIERVWNAIKDDLPEFTRSFWEKKLYYFQRSRLKPSFYYHGVAGNVAYEIKRYLDSNTELRDQLLELLECDSLHEQQQVFCSITPDSLLRFINMLAGNPLFLTMLGMPRPRLHRIHNYYPGGITAYLYDRIKHVAIEIPMNDNYFWRVYLKGEYTRECAPEYLKQENFDTLRERLDRVYTYNQPVNEFLHHNPGNYTHFVMLDHFDWQAEHKPALLEEELNRIIQNSAQEARIIFRSAADKVDFIPASIIERLRTVKNLSHLHEFDRVGTYGSLFFAEISKKSVKRRIIDSLGVY